MAVSRREFLAGVGGVGLAYAFHLGCRGDEPSNTTSEGAAAPAVRTDVDPGIDYRQWLVVGAGGTVTAFTCRVEIGQGLKTVLFNVLCQGMDLPVSRVQVVLGDTSICPADGPTTGSAATRHVIWAFWKACSWVRGDLLRRAAKRLDVEVADLRLRRGEFVDGAGRSRLSIADLVENKLQITEIDPDLEPDPLPEYVDRQTLNVNGEAIVTGAQIFAGDLYPEGCLYGDRLQSPYHAKLSRMVEIDTRPAENVPGVVAVREDRKGPVVYGETFTAVRKGLAAIEAVWEEPERPQRLDNETEIRERAELLEVIVDRGDVDAEFATATRVLSESYVTQYASQVPIEPYTAVAEVDGDRAVVSAGTQNPLLIRYRVAKKWQVPESNIRVVGMPVGGGFGAKTGQAVPVSTAAMARQIGRPVKQVPSRSDQFNSESKYKESVIVDIASAVDQEGRVSARQIDIYQDRGEGTDDVYTVANERTRLFRAPMPVRHGIMRGTSYVQGCYALESHIDMLARTLGEDPLAFRLREVSQPGFRPLLERCAEMAGWREGMSGSGRGKGVALCHHGGLQLGVVVAEVEVDRTSGGIRVVGLWGAFDIGTVINRNTLALGVQGAMLWGLGYALFEEVQLDGHRSFTHSLADYRIPRFSDTPPIGIDFLDNAEPGSPRGCGELPVIPTIGAICNAVYDATGARLYQLPMTPERVMAALARA